MSVARIRRRACSAGEQCGALPFPGWKDRRLSAHEAAPSGAPRWSPDSANPDPFEKPGKMGSHGVSGPSSALSACRSVCTLFSTCVGDRDDAGRRVSYPDDAFSSSASERELGEGSGQRSQKVPEVAASLWKCRATLGLSNASVALRAGLCLRDRQSRPKRDGPQTQRTGGEGKRAGGGRRCLLSSSPVPRAQALRPKKERERDLMPKQGPVTRSLLHAAARPSGRNLECERTLSPEARRLRPRRNLEPTEVVSPDTADGGP